VCSAIDLNFVSGFKQFSDNSGRRDVRFVEIASLTALVTAQLVTTPLLAQDSRNLPPPGYPGGPQEFAGTLRCASYNNQQQSCSVGTGNRVVLLEREQGNCRQNYDWGYDNRRIWVRNRCIATFGYGYTSPNRPQPQPPVGSWDGQNFAGTLECVARDRQQERCYVATENRVELLYQDNNRCVAGQNWGYTRDFIWVSNRCKATFGYGNRYRPQPPQQGNGGPSAGAIIGGVLVAGGLIALLTRGKTKTGQGSSTTTTKPEFPPKPPATIAADLSPVKAAARSSLQNCLFEAARQIGVTGGSRLRFDRVTSVVEGNGGWRINAALTSTYPDGDRATPMFCRATSGQVIELTFTE
jgi:Protein of unknown function (DUF3011)